MKSPAVGACVGSSSAWKQLSPHCSTLMRRKKERGAGRRDGTLYGVCVSRCLGLWWTGGWGQPHVVFRKGSAVMTSVEGNLLLSNPLLCNVVRLLWQNQYYILFTLPSNSSMKSQIEKNKPNQQYGKCRHSRADNVMDLQRCTKTSIVVAFILSKAININASGL